MLRHDNYVPLFQIGIVPTVDLPVDVLLSGKFDLDEFDKLYSPDWRGVSWYSDFIKKCIEKKYYHILMLTTPNRDSVMSATTLKAALVSRITTDVVGSSTGYIRQRMNVSYGDTIPSVIERVRLFNSWRLSQSRKDSSGNCKTYVTNLMFLAETNTKVDNFNEHFSILMCAMVPSDMFPIIRARILAGFPLPVEAIELWTDSKLEAEGSKIKPFFRKSIKTKMEASGVPIKVFPDLTKEILRCARIRFATEDEKEQFGASVLQEVCDNSNGKTIINPPAPLLTIEQFRPVKEAFEVQLQELLG